MNDIIDELKKELYIYKKHFSKIREMDDYTYKKLYIYFKDLDILNLLKERYEYGFNLEIDIKRIFKEPVNLTIKIENISTFSIDIPIVDTQLPKIDFDKELLDFVSEEIIKKYAFIFKKENIKLSDLPNLLTFAQKEK